MPACSASTHRAETGAWARSSPAAGGAKIEPKLALDQVINHAEDHVIIIEVGPATAIRPRIESLGKAFSVVERGPVIV